MAAKTGVKASVKTGAAKPAAAPKTPETVEKSTGLPGAGAPADNTAPPGGESEAAKSAREADEKLMDELRDEAERLNREWDDEAARVLADEMAVLHDEALAMDLVRTEGMKTTQTAAEEGAESAVTLSVWALPEIGEFPATVTLENHTRNRIPVAGANVALLPYETAEVTVSQEQFAKLAKALTSSARAHKWDNFKGLQVKYDRKN